MGFAPNILIVDDEKGMRDFLSFELGSRGYSVSAAATGAEALALLTRAGFDLVISDIKMPQMDGLELLESAKRSFPDTEFIISTGYATIGAAVEAMKKGAYDFIEKPFNLDELTSLLENVFEKIEYRKMLAVYEGGGEMFSKIELKELLPALAGISLRLFKADDVSIMLPGKDGGLAVAGSAGTASDEARSATAALAWTAFGPAGGEAKPLVLGPGQEPALGAGSGVLPPTVRSLLLLPLSLDGRFSGVVAILRTSAGALGYGAADVFQARLYGAQVARALHNARLYGELASALDSLRKAQAQLLRSEKLAAIGRLTAGMAHEINNPLVGIIGYSELLAGAENLSPEQREDVLIILSQSRRCRDIVRSLLQFAREKGSEKTRLPLKELLEECLKFCAYELSKVKMDVNLALPADLPPVSGDRKQLQQVVLNLVGNAIGAVKSGAGGHLNVSAGVAGNTVTMCFLDDGRGIAAEDLPKIFDPFFTTKPPGEGTGLGLSVAYGIIQDHSGRIYAQSEAGKGASLFVELPVWEGE